MPGYCPYYCHGPRLRATRFTPESWVALRKIFFLLQEGYERRLGGPQSRAMTGFILC